MSEHTTVTKISYFETASWIIMAVGLVLTIKLGLLSGLLSGLLVYHLIRMLSFRIKVKGLSGQGTKLMLVALFAIFVIAAIIFSIIGSVKFFRGSGENLHVLMQKLADIVDNSMVYLPHWLVDFLPSDTNELKSSASDWLREHANELQLMGRETLMGAVHILVGMVLGALIVLNDVGRSNKGGPLSEALVSSITKLASSFRQIVFAQVRISAINTVFASLYLAVALPIMGIHLPFTKAMIAITFVVGLLPVVGNLISNTVVFIVSLNYSFNLALSSLGFMIIIHKLEYFLNAKIIGSRIKSKAWELLVAMVFMEAAFGLPGVVAAPIYYAYLKEELMSKKLL